MICDSRIKNDIFLGKVRDLAKVLSKISLTNSDLLPCRGVVKAGNSGVEIMRISFIFAIPQGNGHSRNLRSLLMSGDQSYHLDQRFDFAKQLARSVMYPHIAKSVHKNIRPETILVFAKKKSVIGSAYLVGFEKFRPVDRESSMLGDSLWYKDTYRHPGRQGAHPEEEYKMQHDIYSWGYAYWK